MNFNRWQNHHNHNASTMNHEEFLTRTNGAPPRALACVLGIRPADNQKVVGSCPHCGGQIWQTAGDVNTATCLSPRCAALRGKLKVVETTSNGEIKRLNADALSAVQVETQLRLKPDTYASWRPTKRTTGTIPGLPCAVLCLATDGNLGIMVPQGENKQLGSAFLGHLHRFEWQNADGEWMIGPPPTLHSESALKASNGAAPKVKQPRKKSKKQLWLKELERLTDTQGLL